MSDGKNQNDIQEYLDLLEEYSNKNPTEAVSLAEKNTENVQPSENNENIVRSEEINQDSDSLSNEKKLNFETISDELDKADFFGDYEEEKSEEKPSDSEKIEKEKNIFKRLSNWFNNLPKKKKIIVSVITIVLAVILALGASLGIFVSHKLSLIGDNSDNISDDIIYDDEPIEDIEIDIGSADFKQSLIDWATTGNDKHMYSKNVVNVLLIGADSRYGKNEGNTDVMMLVSVNRKTKKLTLTSLLRDSYLYIEGNNSSYCTKLNAAFSMGGPECLLRTIENNYKISIDNYVMVNFESFTAIVDAMGGINVDVKAYEANYIESHYDVSMPIGENVKLNGKQALVFCRVRGCDADGDVSRTRRQRQVIDSMVSKATNSTISELNKYIDIFLPYVDTGYSGSQIVSLGLKAVTGGWAKYERSQISMPAEDCRIPGNAGSHWIWVVDYLKAAHDLQMAIYGESNITLPDQRITMIDVYNGASYTNNNSGNVISDNNQNNKPEMPDTTEKATNPVVTDNNSGNEKTTAPFINDEEADTTQAQSTTAPVETEAPGTTAPVATDPPQTTLPVVTQGSGSNNATQPDGGQNE